MKWATLRKIQWGNKKRRARKIYLYGLTALTVALVLLFFVVVNPLSETHTHTHTHENYIADAGEITT